MNRYIIFFLLLITCNFSSQASNIDMLSNVNAEWLNNSDGQKIATGLNTEGNATFNDWITTHLMLVEKTLRARSVDHLTFEQKENRTRLLNVLNDYWHTGLYPVNDYLSYKNPIFIDRKGTHCAVGYLMQQSGAENLARAIDTDNKFVFVKDIKTKGVAEWSSLNGFTIDELAWIQPAYQTQFNVGDMVGGLNGPVMTLAVDPNTQMVYAGGSFSASTTGNPCNGIAAYISGIAGWEWIGLGSGGVSGTVNSLLIHDNKIYVGGDFNTAGSVSASNIAVFDLASQQWQAMGSLDSTVYALAVYDNEIYAGGKFTGFVSKWTGSQWQDVSQGFIYGGGVRTLEEWNGMLLIGGDFELATGAIRKNVATYDGTQMGTSGMGTLTPVNDFEVFRDTLYAACDFVSGTDTCAIAKFSNFDWEVALRPFSIWQDYFSGSSVKSLLVEQDKLFCGGEFSCSSGFFYGNNLMEFQILPNGQTYCVPLLIVDDGINAIVQNSNTIVFGGYFSNALGDTLNHVGELLDVIAKVPVTKGRISESLAVFPNPTGSSVQVRIINASSNGEYMIRIFDQIGHEVYSRKINSPEFSSDLFSELPDGVYYVQARHLDGQLIGSQRILVVH